MQQGAKCTQRWRHDSCTTVFAAAFFCICLPSIKSKVQRVGESTQNRYCPWCAVLLHAGASCSPFFCCIAMNVRDRDTAAHNTISNLLQCPSAIIARNLSSPDPKCYLPSLYTRLSTLRIQRNVWAGPGKVIRRVLQIQRTLPRRTRLFFRGLSCARSPNGWRWSWGHASNTVLDCRGLRRSEPRLFRTSDHDFLSGATAVV